jgi:hypothetical protein
MTENSHWNDRQMFGTGDLAAFLGSGARNP